MLFPLQVLAPHRCHLEYLGQIQQTMIMVQFQAILHIEQASQVIQVLMVIAVDMEVIQGFLVAMALVMEAMVTTMVDMEVTTLMEELMEGQVIIGNIKNLNVHFVNNSTSFFIILSQTRFISMAEESSQPAFQSLESIVHAFGSISMMLESTLSAVYSSFRAVLGMADQFSRMRTHLSKVFSALAIFRTAKWALHKLFYIFGMSDYIKSRSSSCSHFYQLNILVFTGLRRENPINTAWSSAISSSDALSSAGLLTEADIKKSRSSWPITLFLAIIISAPYFIWRIISSLDSTPDGLGVLNKLLTVVS